MGRANSVGINGASEIFYVESLDRVGEWIVGGYVAIIATNRVIYIDGTLLNIAHLSYFDIPMGNGTIFSIWPVIFVERVPV